MIKYYLLFLGLSITLNTQLFAQNTNKTDSINAIKSKTMKIIAIEKDLEGVDWKNAKEILEEEAREVYQLYLKGVIREIYFTENKNAVLILECENKGQAIQLLDAMPLVQKKYTRFEIMELRPYSGWSRLMQVK